MSDLPYPPPTPQSVEAERPGAEPGAAGSPDPEPTAFEDATSGVVSRPASSAPPPAAAMDERDLVFINALSSAGLLGDLGGDELSRIAATLGNLSGAARRITFLETYYAASDDKARAGRRRMGDRFFMHRASDVVSARDLVRRLDELCPEIEDMVLERIGDAVNGALVLRSGEHFAGIVDDYELEMDTDEIDLRDLAEEKPTITVRGLVRATNILLQRHGFERRFVQLNSDVFREVYVAIFLEDAKALCKTRFLEHDEGELIEHASW